MADSAPLAGRGAPLNRGSTRFGLPTREMDGDWLDAQEVVDVHDDAVLRDAAEDGRVAGLLPPEVGEQGLRARAVGMRDDASLRVPGQVILGDLAERAREEAAVQLVHGGFPRCLHRGEEVVRRGVTANQLLQLRIKRTALPFCTDITQKIFLVIEISIRVVGEHADTDRYIRRKNVFRKLRVESKEVEITRNANFPNICVEA